MNIYGRPPWWKIALLVIAYITAILLVISGLVYIDNWLLA